MKKLLVWVLAASAAAPAQAEVLFASETGFALESRVIVPVPPARAYQALGRVGDWWDGQHSYSGSAANLSLELRAGGCFCERLPADGGSIEHGRVVMARPGDTLRLSAALGPLQGEGTSGALTWTLRPSGSGTEIIQTYIVGGFVRGGVGAQAAMVDEVMSLQLNRLRDHLSR